MPGSDTDPTLALEAWLGPEHALDTPVLGPVRADGLAAAFNGQSYLVVWEGAAARVAPDGTVLDPTAIAMPVHSYIDVASDGDGFLVVGEAPWVYPQGPWPGLHAVHVSADGVVLNTSLLTTEVLIENVKVASSGTGYLVVWGDGDLHRARVAPDGTVLDPGGVQMASFISGLIDVGYDGESYVALWDSIGANPARVAALSPEGDLLSETTLPVVPEAMDCNASAGHCVIVWDDSGLKISRMTSQGALLDPLGVDVTLGTNGGPAVVGFDGLNTIVGYGESSVDGTIPEVRYARVSPDGVVLDPEAVFVDNASYPTIASDGQHALLLWSDGRFGRAHSAIFGKRIGQDGTEFDGAGVLVSSGPNQQRDPSIAYDGQAFTVAWSDTRNVKDAQKWDVYAARVDPDGALLDPTATLMSTGPLEQGPARALFDGSSTLITAWDCLHTIFGPECALSGARLGPGGTIPLSFPYLVYDHPKDPPAMAGGCAGALVSPFASLLETPPDVQPTSEAVAPTGVVGPLEDPVFVSTRIASAFDGLHYLVVWIPEFPVGGGPLFAARIAGDGTPVGDAFQISPLSSDVRSFSLAFGDGVYLVAWSDATTSVPRVLAARVSVDGVVLDPTPIVVAEHPDCPAHRVAFGTSGMTFDGQRFALGWKECGPDSPDLTGAFVDSQGAVRAVFPITSDTNDDDPPALSGTGAGTSLVAYASRHAGPHIATSRVYTRRLAAIAAP